jgi:hypothetical protein
MTNRYQLGGLGNEELLAVLCGLVKRENEVMSDLLACLAELDERRLYLDLGYTSLFAYCTEALGFCKSSAGRRIAVARVCRRFPGAFGHVARGELQLSVLSLLSSHLNSENATELFAACSRKSCDQVEELLAARFPKPDVRDSIRRLPVWAAPTPAGGSAHQGSAASPSEAPIERVKSPVPPPQQPFPERKLEPLSPDRFGVHFTADSEFRELLEEVRALASHSEPEGDLLRLMKRGLEAYQRELQKRRFGVGRKPRPLARVVGASRQADVALPPRSRHVPAELARAVYSRDGGQCTFCSIDGRRCGARRFLQLDHAKPWAVGGESTLDNLRLRCRAHNLHSARRYFGVSFMRKKQSRVSPGLEDGPVFSAPKSGPERSAARRRD